MQNHTHRLSPVASLLLAGLAGCAPVDGEDDRGAAVSPLQAVTAWRANVALGHETTAATASMLSLHDVGMSQTALVVHRGASTTNLYAGLLTSSRTTGVIIPPGGDFQQLRGLGSKSRPVLARRGNVLHMIHQGASSDALYWATLDLSRTSLAAYGHNGLWYWNNWVEVPLGLYSTASPDLVYDPVTDRLQLVYAEGNTIWVSSSDGTTWGQPVRVAALSSLAPNTFAGLSATMFNGALAVVGTFDLSVPGINYVPMFGYRVPLPARTNTSSPLFGTDAVMPGLTQRGPVGFAAFRGVLHVVHRGQNTSNLWWNTAASSSWNVETQVPNQSSGTQPVLGVVGNDLVMLHTGGSSAAMWASRYDDGT